MRLFEITSDDQRKSRQPALSAERLAEQLTPGWTVTGEVFDGGYVIARHKTTLLAERLMQDDAGIALPFT